MSFKRAVLEKIVGLYASCKGLKSAPFPENPQRIFILRNNDLGDVLVITPLFEALKKRFPTAETIAGVGPWAAPILENNPHVDRIVPISAPWHNKVSARHSSGTFAGWIDALHYLKNSPEIEALRDLRCDVGIDVLGSPQGSLLMSAAEIPFRIGVKGYAGGYSACNAFIQYNQTVPVGEMALVFAKILGARDLPSSLPQLYLTQAEIEFGKQCLKNCGLSGKRITAMAPGAGLPEKAWPIEQFAQRACEILEDPDSAVVVLGGPGDTEKGNALWKAAPEAVNLCGKLSLRESFAIVNAANAVIANSSLMAHVGPALRKPTLLALGPAFTDTQAHLAQWGHPGYTTLKQ